MLLGGLVAAPAEPGRVGQVNGLVIRLHRGPEGTTVEGAILPVIAFRNGAPEAVVLQHGGELGASTRDAVAAVGTVLPSLLPGWPALGEALARHGLRLRFGGAGEPVDGGSAGLAMLVAACSALADLPVPESLAITGVLAPDGRVAPVEGLPLKLAAAARAGCETVIVPAGSLPELTGDALEQHTRLRLVAVDQAARALFDAFGEAGPRAAAYRDYRARFTAGLEAVAAGDWRAGETAFGRCLDELPEDLSAAWWRDRCRRPGADSEACLLQAAALRRLGRYGEAATAARVGRAAGLPDDRVARFLTDLRWQQATGERTRKLRAAEGELLDGAPDRAEALLVEAERTLAAAPDGAEALAAARADLRRGRLRLAAEQHPERQDGWLALAAAADEGACLEEAVVALERARQAGPDAPELRYRQAVALRRLGESQPARAVLAGNLSDWPAHEESRELLAALGVDRVPPVVTLRPSPAGSVAGTVRVEAGTDDSSAALTLYLDDRPLLERPSPLLWEWDTTTVPDGAHRLVCVAADPSGNLAATAVPVVVANGEPPRPPRVGVIPAAPGFAVDLIEGGSWLVREDDALRLLPEELFRHSLQRAGATADQLRLGVAGLERADGTTWRLPKPAGPVVDLRIWSGFADGRAVGPVMVRLVRENRLLATVVTPAGGALRPGRVPVRVDPSFQPLVAWLLIDGRVRAVGAPGELVADPRGLAAGRHALSVVLADGAGRHCQTAPVTLRVE